MGLMDKLLKASSAQGAAILSESDFFLNKDTIPTPLPILNIAFSGQVDGGLTTGLTILAGESKTFKSALSLYCMKAYLDRYPDAIAVLYDSEFGITNDYIKSFGLDPSRIIHIPVEHIEQLKFDFVKKLEEIQKGDKVFFLVDSIGQISSKKEVEDAVDEKSVADMTRAKAIRSLLRLVTIQLTLKDIPCIMINHVYQSIGGLFPTTVIPGGSSVTYSSNQIFVITKAQEKTGADLAGWKFTLNVYKSRFVKEKAKLPFTVMYESGIQKYSGMLDLAKDAGLIIQAGAWYNIVDLETGEISEKKYRATQLETDEILGKIIESQQFKDYVKDTFTLSGIDLNDIITDNDEVIADEE